MPTLQKQFLLLKAVILASILVLVTFIAYRDALNNGFMAWDSGSYIVENPHIKALTWENLKWMLTAFYVANWHPLTWLSHAIDYALFGMNPWGHHLTNLIIHGLNVIGFFMLSMMLLTLSVATTPLQFAWTQIDDRILLAAFVAALLFGIHPQHVESVAWLAERKDVLCLFFILLSLWSYLFYTLTLSTTPGPSLPRKEVSPATQVVCTPLLSKEGPGVVRSQLVWYVAALISFALALLSKPMAVTLPVILILMDIYPLRRTSLTTPCQAIPYKTLVLEKIPFFVLTVISAILTLLAQQSFDAVVSIQTMGIELRLLNAFNSIILYISKFILPVSLSPFYLMSLVQKVHHYLSVMGGVLITFVCGYLWSKKQYYWLIAWLFYLITLLPVLGLIQVGSQAAADRYTYLPTLPFELLIGVGVATLYYQSPVKRFLKVGMTIGLLVIMTQMLRLTQEQTWIWKNDLSLWTYTILYEPDNPMAQMNLGVTYFRLGEMEKAIVHLKAAASMSHSKLIYLNMLGIFFKLNRLADALILYQMVLESNIDIGQSKEVIYYNMGNIYHKQGELEKAQEFLNKALTINPNNESARSLLTQVTAALKK